MSEEADFKKSEIKRLEKENKKIRKKLDNLIGIENPIYSPIWVNIGDLIDNEIEQEGWCNE